MGKSLAILAQFREQMKIVHETVKNELADNKNAEYLTHLFNTHSKTTKLNLDIGESKGIEHHKQDKSVDSLEADELERAISPEIDSLR